MGDILLAKVPVSDSCKRLGNITLVRKLGQGGMGAVYLGRHDLLEIDVAVKVVLFHLMQDPRRAEASRQRFLREARLTARLDHAGIVRILEMNVDRESNLTYIVMEYVNGGSAMDVIDKLRETGHDFSEKRLLEVGVGVAEALQAAHEAGIIHRDVKPANVLIRKPEWLVKLADLGLAKSTAEEEALSRSGAALGTPSYMPPEQFSDTKHIGPAIDIYGLGATLYHLATGSVPFQADSIFALINKIVTESPRPARELRPDLSVRTESILEKAMMRRPGDRYRSAEEMGSDLRIALASLP
jgi:serine/threonine protein kinase